MYAPVRILLKQRYDNMTKKLLELFQEDVSTICSILMNFLISCCGKQKLIAYNSNFKEMNFPPAASRELT